ncbi:MAG: hypothetical protein JW995_02630 [Melioribacteraceae bacterium]|nr:hypothetical protein [Melioribacteraceae bacterium]
MITFFVLHSTLEPQSDVKARLLNEITRITDFNEIRFNGFVQNESDTEINLELYDGMVLFIATGGTEQLALELINKFKKPILMIANSQKNSLAAAMEIFGYLKSSAILNFHYWESDYKTRNIISSFIKVGSTITKINNSVLGLIGTPSDWLLTSKNHSGFGSFKTKIINIETEELIRKVKQIDDRAVAALSAKLKEKYGSTLVSEDSLITSLKVYAALKDLINKYQLTALSIRCFDLLEHNYTSCIAMSMLNDENIISGCEGDLEAVLSMMLGAYLTGTPCWMANPSALDSTENTLVLAHCTIPSRMLSDLSLSNLTTHMESGLSTANQGPLLKGTVTIFRIGENFKKLLAANGRIIDSDMRIPSLCRTQVKIQLESSVNEWLHNSVGNHQVMVYGDITGDLSRFCKLTGIEFNWINS